MAIAKGRTNCHGERAVVFQGFEDLLAVVAQSKNQAECHIKARLYDIITDYSIPKEERNTLESPWQATLSDIEEKDIRIRRAIFVGIFSFFELFLKELCEYYKIPISEKVCRQAPKVKMEREGMGTDSKQKTYTADYLKAIYHGTPYNSSVQLVYNGIRKLRNGMTHGFKKGDAKIDAMIEHYPKFGVVKNGRDYYFSSYEGLKEILDVINHALDEVEEMAETYNIKI